MRPPQVGFAIGRAVGNAVERNRLRRRLRALLHDVMVPDGLLLIGANPRSTELTFDELRRALDRLLAPVIAGATDGNLDEVCDR